MIPFNKPYFSGRELKYLEEVCHSTTMSGNGDFTKKCHTFFEQKYGFKKCLLATSGTDALEMCAMLCNLEPGDEVFQRDGSIQEVLAVFPQKMMDIYRVHFSDGRYLDAGGEHLWGVYTSKMRNNKAAGKDVDFKVMSTLEMLNSGVTRKPYGNRVGGMKYFIPMNGAVQWPEVEFPVDPYVLGAFIGDGSLTSNTLTISGEDVDLIERISDILGFAFKEKTGSYGWVFLTGEMYGTLDKLVQTSDIIPDPLGLKNVYSKDRFIPEIYKQGSVDQRWELI